MNQTSIIVYRNPLEQQIWEGIYNSDIIGYIAGIVLVVIVTAILWNIVVKPLWQKITRRNPRW